MAEYARAEINAIGGYYAFGTRALQRNTCSTLTPPSSASTPWTSAWRASRSMTSCGMNTTSRSSSANWQYPGVSVHRRPSPGAGAAGQCAGRGQPPLPQPRHRPDEPGIHRPGGGGQFSPGGVLRRQGNPAPAPGRGPCVQRVCHVLSPRASPSWPRASASPPRFWIISSTPRPRAAA